MKKPRHISRIFDFSILRILFVIAAIMFLVANIVSATTMYTVPTSKGDVQLQVPEGQTMEQAYIGVAQLYLEERYDYDELKLSTERLMTDVELYQDHVSKLTLANQNLTLAQTSLTAVLDAKVKTQWVQPMAMLSIGSIGTIPAFYGSSVTVGVLAFEKIIVGTSVIFPFNVGFTIGMVF